MKYAEFKSETSKPKGMASNVDKPHLGLSGVPLLFVESLAPVLKEFENYSSLEDLLYSVFEEDSFEELFANQFSQYEALALVDLAAYFEDVPDEDREWDSFFEFALFVDKEDPNNAVYYFSAGEQFEEVSPSFEEFYSSLAAFK